MLSASYVPPDIVPLIDGSAHFRFRVLERKEHCLAEIEPPEAGGHSERLLPYLRTAELGNPVVVYLGDFVESAHGYLRIMKNGAIFRLLHGCYLIVAYKLVYLPDKWEFDKPLLNFLDKHLHSPCYKLMAVFNFFFIYPFVSNCFSFLKKNGVFVTFDIA